MYKTVFQDFGDENTGWWLRSPEGDYGKGPYSTREEAILALAAFERDGVTPHEAAIQELAEQMEEIDFTADVDEWLDAEDFANWMVQFCEVTDDGGIKMPFTLGYNLSLGRVLAILICERKAYLMVDKAEFAELMNEVSERVRG